MNQTRTRKRRDLQLARDENYFGGVNKLMLNRFGFRNASLLHSPIFTPFPQIFILIPQCHAKQQRNPEKNLLHLVALLALRCSLKKRPLPRRSQQSLEQRKQIRKRLKRRRLKRRKTLDLRGRSARHQTVNRTMQQRRPRKKCDFSFSRGNSVLRHLMFDLIGQACVKG